MVIFFLFLFPLKLPEFALPPFHEPPNVQGFDLCTLVQTIFPIFTLLYGLGVGLYVGPLTRSSLLTL